MTESFEPHEAVASVEKLRQEFELALVEVETAAAAVGQYEAGRPEAEFGMTDNLAEAKKVAAEKFDALLGAVIARGEAEGVKRQNDSFDFRV